MEIKKLIEYGDARSILVHGEPGSGKTTFAASAPGPIFMVDVESGLTGLPKNTNIEYATITKFQDLRDVYLKLIGDKNLKYKTIVLDSLTMIGNLAIEEVKGGKDKQMTFQEWGAVVEKITSIVKNFRDFPLTRGINLVMTAITKKDQDEERLLYVPELIGKSSGQVMALVDAVLYTYTQLREGKLEHKVLTRNNGKIAAKIRSSEVALVIDPNMSELINKLNQKKEEVKVSV